MEDKSEVPLIKQNGYHKESNGINGFAGKSKKMNGATNGTSDHQKRTRGLIVLGLIGVGLFFLYYWYSRSSENIDFNHYYRLVESNNKDCHIPRPDPWDSTIKKYIEPPPILTCKKLQTEFTYMDDRGWLRINQTARKADGYGAIECQYRCFDKSVGLDDVTNVYGEWKSFKTAQPGCEFVEVSCSRSFPKISIYTNLHHQIVVNQTRLKQLPPSWKRLRSPKPGPKSKTSPLHVDRPPSVLVYVLDSVSHSNARRNLPKLLQVLEKDYGSVTFDGYAKVGDNSFPNAAAMLTGKRVNVAGYKSELPDDMSKDYFDDWPLVWKDFHHAGYVTYYAEDYPEYNLFKYLSNGFRGRPVDHYFRPFWVQLWPTFLHKRSSHLCYGNRPKLNLQMNYLRQFLSKYRGSPNFSFNWQTELGHDWLNQVGVGDDYIADFFLKMKPYLNDTFVFVLSDHGHRFDRIRESVIGRIEERMPIFTVSVPQWAREAYPEMVKNLRSNSQTLTSPYDLYVTFHDILGSGRDWRGLNSQRNWTRYAPRGLSLFRPIPKSRACRNAGITEDFCICQHERAVNVSDPTVVRGSDIVLKHVNSLLSEVKEKCATLSLKNIRNAQTFLPNHNMIEDKEVSMFYGGNNPKGFYVNYRVTIVTSPGNAVFEGTLRNSVSDNQLSVIGDINRINKYGNQSICVDNALLRKYCYCV